MAYVNIHSCCALVVALALTLAGQSSSTGEEIVLDGKVPSAPLDYAHSDIRIGLPEYHPSLSSSAYGSDKCTPGRPFLVRPGDEVWLVCSRHQDCQCSTALCIHRYECGIGWVPASVDEYFGIADPAAIVTTYVHGNRVDAQTACERGLTMYGHLSRAARADQRIRHVIWSWPSTSILGPVRDVRVKATKTYLQSYILADFVCQHEQQTHVSLIGFSFGARIIVGAQHLLAGGNLLGRRLAPARCEQAPRTRIAIWAPAMPADWIHPAGFNGRAVPSVDRFLVYFNPRDPLLRFYRKKLGESASDALGYRGIGLESLGIYVNTMEQFNAAEAVGPHHKWTRYNAAEDVIATTVHCALWCDLR